MSLSALSSAAQAQTTVTSITLTGSTTIDCPGQQTYTYVVKGTYTPNVGGPNSGQPNPPEHYLPSVYDKNGFFTPDDLLDQRPSFYFPGDVQLLPNNMWMYTDMFTLFANMPDCDVKGKDGSSNKQKATIYVKLTDLEAVLFTEVARSNELDVTSVPEPGSIALLIGMSVTGAGFLARRKRARK